MKGKFQGLDRGEGTASTFFQWFGRIEHGRQDACDTED